MDDGAPARPVAVLSYPEPPSRYYGSTQPPTPPSDTYALFGTVYSVSDAAPTLSSAGRPELFNSTESPCTALRALNRRLLALFVALLKSLTDMESNDSERIVSAIEHVFVNMQYVINLLRPAQARRDIVALLQKQARDRTNAAKQLRSAAVAARNSARDALKELGGVSDCTPPQPPPLAAVLAQTAGMVSMQPPSALPQLPSPGTALRELEDLI